MTCLRKRYHMKRHKIKACCYGAELDLSQTCISGLSLKLGITSPDLRKLNIENCAEVGTLFIYSLATLYEYRYTYKHKGPLRPNYPSTFV